MCFLLLQIKQLLLEIKQFQERAYLSFIILEKLMKYWREQRIKEDFSESQTRKKWDVVHAQ